MPVSVTMPRLGESVTEGTVTRWLKQEGDRVEADEPLLEVSTEKVDTEIPSPAAGVLTKIVVREDETVEVGSELALIAGEGEPGAARQEPAATAQAEPAAQPAAQAGAQPAAPEARPGAQPAGQPGAQPEPARAEPPAPAAPPASEQAAAAPSGETTVVKMPALGESVTEGTITRWLKQVGDSIDADEPLLEVSTDKVDTEIPAPTRGTLLEIKVPEDETAQVGAELAVIGPAGAQPAPPPPAPAQAAPPPAPAQPAPPPPAAPERPPAAQPAAPKEAGGYVTPLVRKLAAEHRVDLGALRGTGVGGRIRKQDVLEAAERQAAPPEAPPAEAPPEARPSEARPAKVEPSPLRGRTEKMSRTRSLIAKRMVESLHISAQLTTVVEVDVTKIARLRERAKAGFEARHGVKLTFLPFFALATVEALRAHPKLNASIDAEANTVTYHDAEHLGVAVDTERGLMVPVIHNAGDLNLAGLAKRIADLADRTRTNKVTPDELSGGTFTLTNTGSRGALLDTPIINQPQVAILGTGVVVKRAVVIDDSDLGELIAPRSILYLALSYDHRLVDGADAARFLATIKERLEGGHFESELSLV